MMTFTRRWCDGRLKGDQSGWYVGVSRLVATAGGALADWALLQPPEPLHTHTHTLSCDLGGLEVGRWAVWRGPLPVWKGGEGSYGRVLGSHGGLSHCNEHC